MSEVYSRWLGATTTGSSAGESAAWSPAGLPGGTSRAHVVLGPDAIGPILAGTIGSGSGINKLTMEHGWDKQIGDSNTTVVCDFTGRSDGGVDLDGALGGQMWMQLTNPQAITIRGAPGAGDGDYGLFLTGTGHSSGAALVIDAGNNARIGLAPKAGNSARYSSVKISSGQLIRIGPDVSMPGGSALPVTMGGPGVCETWCALGAVVLEEGALLNHMEGAVAGLTLRSRSRCNYNSDGAIAGLTVDNATIDFSGDMRSKAIGATAYVGRNAKIWDPHGVVTGFQTYGVKHGSDVRQDEVKLSLGAGKKVVVS